MLDEKEHARQSHAHLHDYSFGSPTEEYDKENRSNNKIEVKGTKKGNFYNDNKKAKGNFINPIDLGIKMKIKGSKESKKDL